MRDIYTKECGTLNNSNGLRDEQEGGVYGNNA
jgi:hypothetical protein